MKKIAIAVSLLALATVAAITVYVESESEYRHETLAGDGDPRALVLFHPGRDTRFSDELSTALAEGLSKAGYAVDRETMTRTTPGAQPRYALIAVVSNTYWWTPDLPTLRYLERARLDGVPAVALIGGAGATGRSQRILGEALAKTGARSGQSRSLWLLRPNDESRMDEPNRAVAVDLARRFGTEAGLAARPR